MTARCLICEDSEVEAGGLNRRAAIAKAEGTS